MISQKKPCRQEGTRKKYSKSRKQGLNPRLLHPAKLPFRMEGQVKFFPDKVKLKEFLITKPLLYEMLKGLIQEKEDQKYEQYNDNKHTYQQPDLKTKTKTN